MPTCNRGLRLSKSKYLIRATRKRGVWLIDKCEYRFHVMGHIEIIDRISTTPRDKHTRVVNFEHIKGLSDPIRLLQMQVLLPLPAGFHDAAISADGGQMLTKRVDSETLICQHCSFGFRIRSGRVK